MNYFGIEVTMATSCSLLFNSVVNRMWRDGCCCYVT